MTTLSSVGMAGDCKEGVLKQPRWGRCNECGYTIIVRNDTIKLSLMYLKWAVAAMGEQRNTVNWLCYHAAFSSQAPWTYSLVCNVCSSAFVYSTHISNLHCKILMVNLTKHLATRVATNIDNGYYCHWQLVLKRFDMRLSIYQLNPRYQSHMAQMNCFLSKLCTILATSV